MRNQHRVGRVDDHEVLDTDGGDDALVRVDVRSPRRDRDPLALTAIAVAVGNRERSNRLPRADVAPIECAPHDRDFAGLRGALHDRVVDRDVRHRGEQRGVDLEHRRDREPLERLRDGTRCRQHAGRVPRERFDDGIGGEREHAGVPHVVSGRQVIARECELRLFDEASRAIRGGCRTLGRHDQIAALDVAEAGFRMRRRDAEGDQRAGRGEFRRAPDGVGECALIADQVIGRHDQQHPPPPSARLRAQRCQRNGGSPYCVQTVRAGRSARRPATPRRHRCPSCESSSRDS